MKFNKLINIILREEEVTKDDKIAALKSLSNIKPYTAIITAVEVDDCECDPWCDYVHIQASDKEHAKEEARREFIKDTFGEDKDTEQDDETLGVNIKINLIFPGHITPASSL
jgi:hypothetical protein